MKPDRGRTRSAVESKCNRPGRRVGNALRLIGGKENLLLRFAFRELSLLGRFFFRFRDVLARVWRRRRRLGSSFVSDQQISGHRLIGYFLATANRDFMV